MWIWISRRRGSALIRCFIMKYRMFLSKYLNITLRSYYSKERIVCLLLPLPPPPFIFSQRWKTILEMRMKPKLYKHTWNQSLAKELSYIFLPDEPWNLCKWIPPPPKNEFLFTIYRFIFLSLHFRFIYSFIVLVTSRNNNNNNRELIERTKFRLNFFLCLNLSFHTELNVP